MAQWRVILTLTAFYGLVWQVWANLEVHMMDQVEVLLSENAGIPCIYKLAEPDSSVTIDWFEKSTSDKEPIYHINSSGSFPIQSKIFSDRINVSHSLVNDKTWNCTLNIYKTQLSDERKFICQVNVNTESKEGLTQLLIFDPPSNPTVDVVSYSTADTQIEEVASCTAEDAHPAPNITWYKDRLPLQSSDDKGNVQDSITKNSNQLYTIKSTLHQKMQIEDKDSEFYCEVSYFMPGKVMMKESESFKITVYHTTTKLTLTQISPEGLVKEGDKVEIRCHANGNPPPAMFFSYNEEILSENMDVLVLENAVRYNDGDYVCSTYDGFSESFNLKVHYLDDVVITPEESTELQEGHDQFLTCNALSSLSTNVTWYKDGNPLEEGNVLQLTNVTYNMAGLYTCKVVVTDLPALKKENTVQVKVRGKPEITGVEGEWTSDKKQLRLSCTGKGYPAPNITWTFSVENVSQVEESSVLENGDFFSTVTIWPTSNITATCESTNELGTLTFSKHFSEMKKITKPLTTITSSSTKAPETATPSHKKTRTGKEGSGVIIAVIIILILLLAILGSVLYFLYKKGKIACGRSGKQDLTKESASKDDIVVEMKSGKSEEAVLLQGVNGDKKFPSDQ
ncbi:melanoma cell adhesion molecule b isoform X2 [Hoplias malabaricus]